MIKSGFRAAAAITVLSLAPGFAAAEPEEMTFFVTSAGAGKGADFGGLAGADAHCQKLAAAAGAGKRSWHAYLSTSADGNNAAVNARDRIGSGPWQNAKGVVVAKNVAELHGRNNLNKETAITERGALVNGRGDKPNMHDILTGSRPDGTAFPAGEDRTCGNWTKGGTEGAAIVGHHDRKGLRDDEPSRSWNSAHASRGGCSLAALKSSGGAGLLYCFAEK